MKTINVLAGDTLEGAQIGDTVINGYGDTLVIVDEYNSTWVLESTRVHNNGWVKAYYQMFKYNPNRQPITAVEL